MIDESVVTIASQKSHQLLTFSLREARAHADVLERPRRVKQAEQKRPDRRAVVAFVPSKARHHAIAVALMLNLEHRALVRLISARNRLGHNPVEARAFKAPEPIRCDI